MDFNIKVSVVIPIYNVENYLRQCMDSIINQTLEDIEIICVNDGSTDSSLEILEEYADKDSRVQIITQENKGLSGARNTGMKHVRGQYTFFIDSDDWVELNTLEELYNKASTQDLDMLFYQILNYNEDLKTYESTQYGSISVVDSSFDERVFTYRDVLNVLFKIPHSAFNKLYKTSFLEDLNVDFPQGLNYEDVLFFFKVFLKASRVSILRKPLYLYRIRDGSITSNACEKSLDIFEILERSMKIIEKTDILDNHLQDFLMYVVVNFKFVYSTVSDDYRDEFLEVLKSKYNTFNLDKIDNSFEGWHYSDIAFYKAIKLANNHREFDLLTELEEYKFLAEYYKNRVDDLENAPVLEDSKKSVKGKIKRIIGF